MAYRKVKKRKDISLTLML